MASSSDSSSNSSNVGSEVSHTEDIQIMSGINCIRPLHVSTPNAQSSNLKSKEGGNEGSTLQRIQMNKLAEDNSGTTAAWRKSVFKRATVIITDFKGWKNGDGIARFEEHSYQHDEKFDKTTFVRTNSIGFVC